MSKDSGAVLPTTETHPQTRQYAPSSSMLTTTQSHHQIQLSAKDVCMVRILVSPHSGGLRSQHAECWSITPFLGQRICDWTAWGISHMWHICGWYTMAGVLWLCSVAGRAWLLICCGCSSCSPVAPMVPLWHDIFSDMPEAATYV